jgi:hypothetical protein
MEKNDHEEEKDNLNNNAVGNYRLNSRQIFADELTPILGSIMQYKRQFLDKDLDVGVREEAGKILQELAREYQDNEDILSLIVDAFGRVFC